MNNVCVTKLIVALVLGLWCGPLTLWAQSGAGSPRGSSLYDDHVLGRIDVFLPPDSLAEMLANPNSNREYRSTVVFTRAGIQDSLFECGLRIRGNTSRNAQKKQFRISFNSFRPGQNLEGISDLNLYGMHNDPSISRAKFYYDLTHRVGGRSARAAHVNLYFNGRFRGVYVNVEQLNEDFLQSEFAQDYGNLYKCLWPADLVYISNNPNDYKLTSGGRRAYELMTNTAADDYSNFAKLIRTLNQTASAQIYCQLDSIFDIESALLTLATDLSTGHWDSYYNKNNFYLYDHPVDGRFRFMPYDPDNTMGIQWGGPNYQTISPFSFTPGESRPLYDKLMANTDTRNIYGFYLRKVANQQVSTGFLAQVDSIRSRIAPFALVDTFRSLDYGYTYSQFLSSFAGAAAGGHVNSSIIPFLGARSNATLNASLGPANLPPVVHRPMVINPYPGRRATIRVRIEDELSNGIQATATVTQDGQSLTIPLWDDGQHGDGMAGDGMYGAYVTLNAQVQQCSVQVQARDSAQNLRTRPCNPMRIKTRPMGPLYLNEIMALNHNGITDQSGRTSDWIELYNGGTQPWVTGTNTYLSDNMANPGLWKLPNISIPAGSYALVWASGDTTRGAMHANFTLSGYGECLGLFRFQNNQFQMLDTLCYSPQIPDVSTGRNGDGNLDWISYLVSTPERSNALLSSLAKDADESLANPPCPAMPNPFGEHLLLQFQAKSGPITWEIRGANGQKIEEGLLNSSMEEPAEGYDGDQGSGQSDPLRTLRLSTMAWPAGLYTLHWRQGQRSYRCKLIKGP